MQNYTVLSIETHLFFARIMKEHALFLMAGFPCKDENWIRRADWFRGQFEDLLRDVVALAEGRISDCVLRSDELTTQFTLPAERRTAQLSGVPIDTRITLAEQRLRDGCREDDWDTIRAVQQINRRALRLLNGLISFKEAILREVNSCRLFTANYPLLIQHILREARLYRTTLQNLQRNRQLSRQNIRETENFWNQIMMEHALFIRGLLDPTEEELIDTADGFADDYKGLLEQAVCQDSRARQTRSIQQDCTADTDCLSPEELRARSLEETRKYREFKAAGAEGILKCQISSIILPLLADHVLREANHYIRILECDQA